MPLKEKVQSIFYTIVVISITVTFYANLTNFYSLEIDETTWVSQFIDGDSFEIPGDEVRLADISAPEYYEAGGSEATEAIHDLLAGETIYLDTDQKSGRDGYGRLIAVVYIKQDSHFINVNKALLLQGVVFETDITNNEFTPSEWKRVVSTLTIQDMVKFLVLSTGVGLVVCILIHFSLSRISKSLFTKKNGTRAQYN